MNNELDVVKQLVAYRTFDGKVQPTTTSLQIAEYFGKEHYNVLRDIKEVMSKCSESFAALNFEGSEYKDVTGKSNLMYILTKDGFTMLAMGYTGEKAMQFKERYIMAFNAMEEKLRFGQQDMPLSYPEALRALAAEVEKREAIEQEKALVTEQRDKAIREKAWIGSQREATAMGTASAATKRANHWKRSAGELADVAETQRDTIDDLNDQIGQGKTWRTTKSIPWLKDVFITEYKTKEEHKFVKVVYQQIGKKLTAIGINMGLPPLVIPDVEFDTVKKHHVRVIEQFYHQLMADPNMMKKYRK